MVSTVFNTWINHDNLDNYCSNSPWTMKRLTFCWHHPSPVQKSQVTRYKSSSSRWKSTSYHHTPGSDLHETAWGWIPSLEIFSSSIQHSKNHSSWTSSAQKIIHSTFPLNHPKHCQVAELNAMKEIKRPSCGTPRSPFPRPPRRYWFRLHFIACYWMPRTGDLFLNKSQTGYWMLLMFFVCNSVTQDKKKRLVVNFVALPHRNDPHGRAPESKTKEVQKTVEKEWLSQSWGFNRPEYGPVGVTWLRLWHGGLWPQKNTIEFEPNWWTSFQKL